MRGIQDNSRNVPEIVRVRVIHAEKLVQKILDEGKAFGKNLRELERIEFVAGEKILKIERGNSLDFWGIRMIDAPYSAKDY